MGALCRLKARLMPARAFEGSDSLQARQLESLRVPFVYRKYFDFDAARCAAARAHPPGLAAPRQRAQRHRQRQQHQAGRRRHPRDRIRGPAGPADPRRTHAGPAAPRPARSAARRKRRRPAARSRRAAAGGRHRFLRRTEHALQYREDEQTHLLPGDRPRAALAAALGMQAGEFEDTLAAHRAFVSRTFRNVFRLVGMGDAEERAGRRCGRQGRTRRTVRAGRTDPSGLRRRGRRPAAARRHPDGQPPRRLPTPAAAASKRCCRPPCAARQTPARCRRRCGCST